jgi:hypothetical protein
MASANERAQRRRSTITTEAEARKAGFDWAITHAVRPTDLEVTAACAAWYGATPVPTNIRLAWRDGLKIAKCPLPENYLTLKQAAIQMNIPITTIHSILNNSSYRQRHFPRMITVDLDKATRCYLSPEDVNDWLRNRPSQFTPGQQAVVDAIAALTTEHDRPPTVREISQRIGRTKNVVSYHLRNLRKAQVVTWELQNEIGH